MSNSEELFSWIQKQLADFPLLSKTHLVGGACRNSLWNIRDFGERYHWDTSPHHLPIKDYDFVVEAEGGAEALAKFWHEKSPDITSAPHALGAGYPIWQLAVETPAGPFDFEFADTQAECFPDPESRQRVTVPGDLEADCKRRDFTINMIYRSLETGLYHSPCEKAFEDLNWKHLAPHRDVPVEKTFQDDPLRILRMIRFKAQHPLLTLHPALTQAAKQLIDRLGILSVERIRDELLKMAVAPGFSGALETMRELGALPYVLPEAIPMIGCEQDPRYHAEGDVWVHTGYVIDASKPTVLQRITALMHDFGKPATKTIGEEDGRIHFYRHEEESVRIAEQALTRLHFPGDLKQEILTLIALHLRGHDSKKWRNATPARRLIRDAGNLTDELLDFLEADSLGSWGTGRKGPREHLEPLREWIAKARVVPVQKKTVLNGHDVMQTLSLSSGPLVREILNALQDEEDEFISQENRTPTREEALALLSKVHLDCRARGLL